MRNNSIQSISLDFLRFPLIIFVVIEHVFNNKSVLIDGHTYNVASINLFNDVMLFVEAFIRGVGVPTFFFISGYVFFYGIDHYSKELYKRKLKSRIRTLLIPYIIWNSLEILIGLLKVFVGNRGFSTYGSQLNFSLNNFLSCFWAYNGQLFTTLVDNKEQIAYAGTDPINVPLWFLRDLMIVVIFTPLIYYILKKTKSLLIVLLGILWIIPNDMNLDAYGFVRAFLFFSFGAYLCINKKDIIFKKKILTFLVILFYPMMGTLYILALKNGYYDWLHWLKSFSILGFLFFSYHLSTYLVRHGIKSSPFLSSASFFIYISHCLIFQRITKAIYIIIKPDQPFEYVSIYIISVCVTIVSLLIIYWIMNKYTQKFLAIITGRRLS